MKKILRNRDFYFIIFVYPLGTALLLYLEKKLIESGIMTAEKKEMYSVLSIAVVIFFVAYTIYEIIDKKLLYKNQGDKLKIKQDDKDWKKERK
jgi:hypothetical protein